VLGGVRARGGFLSLGVEMDTSVTIKTRTLLLIVLVMVALLGAYVAGSAGSSSGPSAAAAAASEGADAQAPTIAMTGTGEATGVPDQLTFAVTIAESASDVSSALDAAGRSARRVLSALNAVGVARSDVQTTGLSVRPQYDYSGGSAVLTGYGASENLSVVVRSLPDAGDAINAAVDAGGNGVRIHRVQLKIGDVDNLLAKARAAAVAEAEDKAQQYADATGSELGAVVTVREVSASPRIEAPVAYRTEADLASVPIRAGSEELEVKVSIVWSLG
jgi:uncharacterized protein YggE